MAKTFTLTTSGRNAACDGFVDELDTDGGGAGGTPSLILASATTAGTLCTISLTGATAFGNAATGVATMTASSPTASPSASGTSTFFRLMTQGTAPVKLAHGNVGNGTAYTCNISNPVLATGDTVTITSMTVTVPAS